MAIQLQQQILDELDLSELSGTELQTFTDGFLEELNDRVNVRVLEMLKTEQVEELQKLIADGDVEKIQQYCEQQSPTYELIMQEEADGLKNEIKSIVDGVDMGDEGPDLSQPPAPPPTITTAKGAK